MIATLLAIPHYNDTQRLEPFLGDLLEMLPPRFEIVVSDDGSRPEERKRLSALVEAQRQAAGEDRAKLHLPLFAAANTGKGGAIQRAWSAFHSQDLVAFADADGAVSASEILRAEVFMRTERMRVDAHMASRVKMLGRCVDRRLGRHLFGRVFATLVSELSGIPVYDSQCGLKILNRNALMTILPHLTVQGFAFDVELLFLLRKAGLAVQEFPVDWTDIPGSKVCLLKDSFRMAFQVHAIKHRLELLGPITPRTDHE